MAQLRGQLRKLVVVEPEPLQALKPTHFRGQCRQFVPVQVQIGQCRQLPERRGQCLERVIAEIERRETPEGTDPLGQSGRAGLTHIEQCQGGESRHSGLVEAQLIAAQVQFAKVRKLAELVRKTSEAGRVQIHDLYILRPGHRCFNASIDRWALRRRPLMATGKGRQYQHQGQ